MSDFGDFNSSNDPTSDFLARERAALGGDADIFTTLDNNILTYSSPSISGIPDFTFDTSSTQYMSPNVSSPPPQNEYTSFESNFPKTENLESSRAFHKAMLPEEEPDVVRQWREKQKQVIAQRDEEENAKKEQVLNKAREEIDKFYEEYNDKKQKAIEENREKEDQRLKKRELSSTENIWTSVVRECDVSNAKAAFPKRDVSRMKSIMLDLRKDQNAPGTIISS